MTMPEIVTFVSSYARAVAAPIHTSTTVTSVARTGTDSGYQVVTNRGVWRCAAVVLASGAANLANIPPAAQDVPSTVSTLTPLDYRTPDALDERGVLIVGASATGVQLAEEIRHSGRPVTICVGEHVRLPRIYRGRDIFWWMNATGILDQRHDEVDDLVRARHVPSPQLIGSPTRRTINLNTLTDHGVAVVGRLARITTSGIAQLSGSLANTCTLADLKMNRLLDTFDEWARTSATDQIDPSHRFARTRTPTAPVLEIDLNAGVIGTIIWATGYRPDYTWLDVPVLDHTGRIRHDGGIVTDSPGLYLLGTNLLRRRRSSYIGGAETDTEEIATHLRDSLKPVQRPTRPCRGAASPQ